MGDGVLVFYDRDNPESSALQDFTKKADRDQGFAVMCLGGIGIFAGIVLFNKAKQKTA